MPTLGGLFLLLVCTVQLQRDDICIITLYFICYVVVKIVTINTYTIFLKKWMDGWMDEQMNKYLVTRSLG